ncbi:uncharacterized protein NEMAJ01_0290 [Nematocida major]|uniref:uncharacterized protein n=1 Tax=Nematocida major TaxID=1912982 RepID=UPI00200831DE|nr:uncharacterized protein NEMAJ01_0290 [Nematocida major]KAH9385394.1 hypothetical protein NEMAJ01_0290 [Nematocida major]
MKSRFELRISTKNNRVLKEALSGVVEGLEIVDDGKDLVIRVEESGRLIKSAHIVVTYTNYILKTINGLEKMEKGENS